MDIAFEKVTRTTAILALAGAFAIFVKFGFRDAMGFLAGAAISYISLRSWKRLAATVGESQKAPATGSALFLALRNLLIGAAIYVMIGALGRNPGALIAGLLVSFAALCFELLRGALGSPSS